jgi:hypothetical protein
MAVAKIATINNYTGLAADTKPTAADVVNGSRFVETDTGMEFIYDGAAWQPLRSAVVGAVADDAAAAGNPIPVAGLADDTTPDSVDEGDTGTLAMTLARELYTRPMRRGAGEVTPAIHSMTGTARETVVTPTSGKKIRIISVSVHSNDTAAANSAFYFGTGAAYTTDEAKAIGQYRLDDAVWNQEIQTWPDGGGPVGAVDDVLSMKLNVSSNATATIHYREE